MPALVARRAKAGDDVGSAVARRVAQHDEITARRAFVAAVVPAAPSIRIDVAVRRDDDVSGVTDAIREDRGAKTRREGESTIVAGAGSGGCSGDGARAAARRVAGGSVVACTSRHSDGRGNDD